MNRCIICDEPVPDTEPPFDPVLDSGPVCSDCELKMAELSSIGLLS